MKTMKNLRETQLLLHSIGLLISSFLERIITSVISEKYNLEQGKLNYHIVSFVLLTALFWFINRFFIKEFINLKWVSKKVFGNKYVGGRWFEITLKINGDEESVDHFCNLNIGYDTDKVYLSGTVYGVDCKYRYNLKTESAEINNDCISYIYQHSRNGNSDITKGYGSLHFHNSGSKRPIRYSGSYNDGNNGQYKVEGFLITDKEIIENLDKSHTSAFKDLLAEKLQELGITNSTT